MLSRIGRPGLSVSPSEPQVPDRPRQRPPGQAVRRRRQASPASRAQPRMARRHRCVGKAGTRGAGGGRARLSSGFGWSSGQAGRADGECGRERPHSRQARSGRAAPRPSPRPNLVDQTSSATGSGWAEWLGPSARSRPRPPKRLRSRRLWPASRPRKARLTTCPLVNRRPGTMPCRSALSQGSPGTTGATACSSGSCPRTTSS